MQGLHISPVQEAAVELMLVSEERLKAHDFAERFKLAVVSSDPREWVSKMFPQWDVKAEPEPVAEDEDLSDTEGQWIFTSEITPEEAIRTLEEMTEERNGTLSWADLGGDEGWQ